MKIKKDYELKKSSNHYIIEYKGIPTNAVFDSAVSLQTVEVLWNLLKEKESTKTEMLEQVINTVDISTVLALGNIDVFVRILKENDIIE